MTKFDVAVGSAKAIAAAKVGGEAPEWLEIFPSPTYVTDDGVFLVDDLAKRLILDEFERRGNELVIDYEHQTLHDVIAPAAGWIKELADRGDEGLWARVEWTERARGFIESGEYRYDSPVYDYEIESRRITKLHHIALTNWPRTHNRTELTNQQIAAKARAKYKEGGMKKFIEKLKAALGSTAAKAKTELEAAIAEFPANVDEAAKEDGVDVNATLGALVAPAPAQPPVASKAVLDLLEIDERADLATVQAKVIALKAPVDMVPRAEHDAVVAELASAKQRLEAKTQESAEQELETLIAANKRKLSPVREREVRAIAKAHGIAHAKKVVELFEEILPAAQAKGAPPVPETATAKMKVGERELDVEPESATLAAKVRMIQKELRAQNKPATYGDAYAELQRREASAL